MKRKTYQPPEPPLSGLLPIIFLVSLIVIGQFITIKKLPTNDNQRVPNEQADTGNKPCNNISQWQYGDIFANWGTKP